MGRQLGFDLGSHLFLGDNLDILRTYVAEETVDLIYLDPPFNSNANYNVFRRRDGSPMAAQEHAFKDTWDWDLESKRVFRDVVQGGGQTSRALLAFQDLILGNDGSGEDLLAYLTMMAPRLVELRRRQSKVRCGRVRCLHRLPF